MASLSWSYVFQPRQAQWWVGIVFTLVGAGLGGVLPAFLMPAWQGVERPASVARFDTDRDGMVRPVFQVEGDARTYAASVWSSRSAYAAGERVTIVTNPQADDWYIKDDKDMEGVVWLLRPLGLVFFAIGGTVLTLTILGVPDYLVQTIGGTMGALSFGIPATFVLPGLWLAHRYRPNMLFAAGDPFGSKEWLLGGLFSALGVITTLAVVVLARYQLRHKSLGWRWSRSW